MIHGQPNARARRESMIAELGTRREFRTAGPSFRLRRVHECVTRRCGLILPAWSPVVVVVVVVVVVGVGVQSTNQVSAVKPANVQGGSQRSGNARILSRTERRWRTQLGSGGWTRFWLGGRVRHRPFLGAVHTSRHRLHLQHHRACATHAGKRLWR